MQTTPHPLKVFLCHAHADKSAVRSLYRHLKERKIDVWLDSEKLLPGQNWQVEIPKALHSSDVIIICLSKNSVDKEGYVQKEIKFALDKALEMPEGRIFLIPARLEECNLPYSLSAFHFVNLFEEDGYKRLLRSLRARAEQIGATKVGQITNVPHRQEPPEPAGQVSNLTIDEERQASSLTYEYTEKAEREKIEREKAERAKAEQEAKEKAKQEPAPEPKKQERRKLPIWGIGLIAFTILAFSVWGLSSLPAFPKSTQTPSTTPTLFVEPATSTVTVIPTPTLGIGSTMIGKDGATLVYVPAGNFTMGDGSNNAPIHTVYLGDFWIDQTEVTNKQYAACVSDGGCTPPSNASSARQSSYYGNSEFNEYPVIYMDWDQANAYCSWAGRELPSEAQWEKAARGTDARIYPWGKDISCARVNYNNCIGDTTEVGSYKSEKSPYGAYDMAGNVWEWVNDWYGETYYKSSPSSNPLGPDSGQYYYRVSRGGAWNSHVNNVRSANRRWNYPINSSSYDGFRCARSLP